MHESISLRDMVGRYGNLSLLSKDELNCIVNYLTTYTRLQYCIMSAVYCIM